MLILSTISTLRPVLQEHEESFRANGEGHDDTGKLTLQGIIRKVDSAVDLKILYDDGRIQHLRGTVTPFGVVGIWQPPTGLVDPVGMFYMWETDMEGL